MPEDLKLSQIGSSQLPPPFRGLHTPGVKKKLKLSLPVISGNLLLCQIVDLKQQVKYMLVILRFFLPLLNAHSVCGVNMKMCLLVTVLC